MSGYIDENGKYIKGKDKPLGHDISPQFRGWSHDNQRKRMAADIAQPRTVDGKPNPDFINIYRGEVAQNYFTQEQIDQADRNLGGLN